MNQYDLMSKWGASAGLKEAKKAPKWVFEGLIEEGDQLICTGAAKSGKSRLVMDLAIAASKGEPFLGHKCPRKIRVLYVDFELKPRVFWNRVLQMHDYIESDMESNGYFFRCPDLKAINVSAHSDELNDLKKKVAILAPDLIIWDVLARMHRADENSNIEMSNVMQSVREVSGNVAHIVVHHSRKSNGKTNQGAEGMRGASAIHAEVDGVISLAERKGKASTHSLEFSLRAVESKKTVLLATKGIQFEKVEGHGAEEISESRDERVNKGAILRSRINGAFEGNKEVAHRDLVSFICGRASIGTKQASRDLKAACALGIIEELNIDGQRSYRKQGA